MLHNTHLYPQTQHNSDKIQLKSLFKIKMINLIMKKTIINLKQILKKVLNISLIRECYL